MGDATTGQPPLAMPSRLVYKKNANLDSKMASLDQERRILQITPEKPNLLDSSSAIDSTINLSTPIATSLRNRSGNEFTLVLKYRISAESAEQKEAWFRQLGALGVHVGVDDEDIQHVGRKDTPGKLRRSMKKSRTESGETESVRSQSPGVFHRSVDMDSPLRVKNPNKILEESAWNGDVSPGTSPRSPTSRLRASSPRVPSPGAHRRGESSPNGSRRDLHDQSPRATRMSDSYSSSSRSSSFSLASGSAPLSPIPLEEELPLTTPRLIRVHGARNNVHCSLVPRVASSLNKNDCFILDDAAGTLYTWKGKAANMFAKSECSDLALTINQANYQGKAKIESVQQAFEPTAFWDLLTSGKGDIAEADTTGITSLAKFFTISFEPTSGAIGEMLLAEEGRTQFKPSLLQEHPIFAIDTGFEIVICDLTQKEGTEPIPDQALIDVARRYKRDKSRPIETRITIVHGNSKQPLLAHFFK